MYYTWPSAYAGSVQFDATNSVRLTVQISELSFGSDKRSDHGFSPNPYFFYFLNEEKFFKETPFDDGVCRFQCFGTDC